MLPSRVSVFEPTVDYKKYENTSKPQDIPRQMVSFKNKNKTKGTVGLSCYMYRTLQ